MKLHRPRRKQISGGALPWVLLGCAVLGIAFFLLRKPAPAPAPVQIVVATPVPATPPPATPEPVKATPTPMPVVVATPTPTPVPATPPTLDLATVVRTPGLWPQAVTLIQATAFPLMLNGRTVGEAKAPAGVTLRVHRLRAQHVEVEYQNARHLIPIASTDLMSRALAAFRANGSVLPVASAPAATPIPVAASATPAAPAAPATSARVAERIGVEVVRMKRSRIEGGDFDDKKDRIQLRVKLTNADTTLAADKFTGEIFVFAESILDRSALKLLAVEPFDFSLPPRGNHEFSTPELETMYDTTGARFGHKYEGWVLRLRDRAGNVVLTKSSSPTLGRAMEKATALAKDKTYDRSTFMEKVDTR